MSLANNKKSLIIAALCACFAFVLVASIALPGSKQQKPVNTAPKYQYVVATREIKVGELIKEEDVAIKDYTINIPSAYKATGEVVGRDAMIKIEAGKPVVLGIVGRGWEGGKGIDVSRFPGYLIPHPAKRTGG